MFFLVLAIIFNYTTTLSETTTGVIGGMRSKPAACISPGLWALVISGGNSSAVSTQRSISIASYRAALPRPLYERRISSPASEGSGYVYPAILLLHMVAITFFGGMLLMADCGLLGGNA